MTARLLCLLVLLLEARGFSISFARREWKMLIYYTQLSNLAAACASALLVVRGQAQWITALRYISTAMLVMTFFVTVFVLIPMGGDPIILLFSGSGLYHHVLCPVISTFSYIFLENHAGLECLWLPVALTLSYGLLMLWLNWTGRADGPYPFFRVRHQAPLATAVWMAVLAAAAGGIASLIWLAAKP